MSHTIIRQAHIGEWGTVSVGKDSLIRIIQWADDETYDVDAFNVGGEPFRSWSCVDPIAAQAILIELLREVNECDSTS